MFTESINRVVTKLSVQVDEILAAMQIDCIDLLYLHAPDSKNPIEPTLDALDILQKAGKFSKFGLSNYSAWEVSYIHAYCTQKGYVVPTVYQGM
jgi:aflatoxin B1 aldehyde reductase